MAWETNGEEGDAIEGRVIFSIVVEVWHGEELGLRYQLDPFPLSSLGTYGGVKYIGIYFLSPSLSYSILLDSK